MKENVDDNDIHSISSNSDTVDDIDGDWNPKGFGISDRFRAKVISDNFGFGYGRYISVSPTSLVHIKYLLTKYRQMDSIKNTRISQLEIETTIMSKLSLSCDW
ncbi:5463_t:CDS:2 [Funneliformis mosseae]|uniref:5463_t:CDS:1 n=1 Tax=Funneliformis mosseae TaxID=27381 RepID=A0A9N9GT68_FUNMO|nr:5463_t:CDS:2 [Funneliformis mosseae]